MIRISKKGSIFSIKKRLFSKDTKGTVFKHRESKRDLSDDHENETERSEGDRLQERDWCKGQVKEKGLFLKHMEWERDFEDERK